MAILKDIVVTNGSYKDRSGQEKKRYVKIGQLHNGEHGDYVTLDAHVNLAAFPRKAGDTRVYANLYDPKPRDGQARTESGPPGRMEDRPFDDSEIPW